MIKKLKIQGLLSRAVAAILGIATCFGACFSSASTDFNYGADKYAVTFQPFAGSKVNIYFRDERGRLLGTASPDSIFDLMVSGDALRASMTSNGISISKLLNTVATYQSEDGRMKFVPMEAPYEIYTQEGGRIRVGTRVMLDLNDFTKLGSIQPSGAAGENYDQANKFNELLWERGTDTRPSLPPAELEAQMPVLKDLENSDELVGAPKIDDHSEVSRETNHPNYPQATTQRGKFPSAFLTSPLCGCTNCPKSSGYGARRDPIDRHVTRMHYGTDFTGAFGTKVVAAADGCVPKVMSQNCRRGSGSCGGGYGNAVVISHGGGYSTVYAHLSRVNPSVRPGKCFKRGEEIGRVGSTGRSTGNHLHFEVLKNGRKISGTSNFIHANDYRGNRMRNFHAQCTAYAVDQDMAEATGNATRGARQSRASSVVR